ncbi:MAG: 2-C-methyl-D-erythritol 2,4-cyclodiphosphate synthase [Chloroflexota bacterium]|nr:2-C-methyl-D-erythritol 2,4-cyclodiphosphate synthase [Chloroflexota bacterium]
MNLNQNENQSAGAVLLCAGRSSRMNGLDKSTLVFDRIPIFIKSLTKFIDSNLFSKVVLVASKENITDIKNLISDYGFHQEVILGGERRQDSVSIAIDYLNQFSINKVVIHDSARPLFFESILTEGIKLLDNNNAVIPIIPIQDTVKKVNAKEVVKTLNRDELFRSQTPQFFNFNILSECISKTSKKINYTDESELLEINGYKVNCINGNIENQKITTHDDLKLLQNFDHNTKFKNGISSDTHKLVEGENLILGGLEIPFEKCLEGHSDADVVLHAITDSIIGALGQGDLGKHFPSSQDKWKNASSEIFLFKAVDLMNELNFEIFHLDIQIILQEPKLSDLLIKIEQNISNLLNLNIEKINLKVTSTDNIGLIGSGDAIGTLCAVTLKESND